jgi:aquaporin Z
MKAYITEFVGTFFLVLAIGLSVVGGAGAMAPLAIGSTLMAMVYMGGHVSGAHYNPAVTLAVFLRGKLPLKQVVPYWVAQIAAALLAAVSVRWILNKPMAAGPIESGMLLRALAVEFIFTFALALVVLNVATAKGTSGNSFYGLAIGFIVVGGALAGGSVSHAAFNPAVGIGVWAMGSALSNLWLWIVGPLAGGAAAAAVFKVQNPDG